MINDRSELWLINSIRSLMLGKYDSLIDDLEFQL
jgi:hypothetical protein